jgi:hypothetical protein
MAAGQMRTVAHCFFKPHNSILTIV